MRISHLISSGAALLSLGVAAPAASSRFQYYNLTTPAAGPCDLTTGPDHAIWADTFLSNKIVHIDIASGKLEEYNIPYTLPPLSNSVLPSNVQGTIALACVIQPGDDGNMYAATGVRNQFVRINTVTKKVTVFNTNNPLGNLQPLNDAWPGETGMFFSQTTANVIALFDYKKETFTNYEVPTPAAGPVGMIIPADGALWFCEFFANKIGRLNITDGTFMEYPVPATLLGPAVMRAQTQDRYIWFTATVSNAIGRVDITNGEMKAFTNPELLNLPIEDTVDSQGNIWFSTLTQNTLNFVTPSTGKFTSIEQPGTAVVRPASLPPAADIAIHYEPSDNSIWFTELAEDRVGRYQL